MSGKNEIRNAILNADDLPRERVPTPEWPVKELWVRTMAGPEDEASIRAMNQMEQNGGASVLDVWIMLLINTVCDETGTLIFRSQDAPALRKKNGATLRRLAVAALRLNGLTAQAVGELEKNLEPTRGSASGSSLPTTSGSLSGKHKRK